MRLPPRPSPRRAGAYTRRMPSDSLYLGKELDAKTGKTGRRLDLDPSDLLTHGLIVGMTGSGKTGLAIALIEEVLRQGVPVLAIDPKGDLGNLLLLFDDLAPAAFSPWIDPEAARRAGQTVEQAAEAASKAWTAGLAEWDLGPADVAALKKAHSAAIYTPGSAAGRRLNALQSLEAPAADFDAAAEDLRDEIQGIVAGLLGLLRIEADPLQSREFVLLSNIIEASWRAGKGLNLESLITAVAEPPFEKVGALPLESVYPRKERQGLMMALNNLLASPSFEAWRTGEPLDVEQLLWTKDHRPRLSIVYTAHLDEQERLFITALLLDKVKTWMRRQPGTAELRALVYMDEIFGYFPPHPQNPPTKRPLLTLLKQARAQGVGVVLATQNPVDIDYKGLANMGTWLVGRLQTEQDRARLRDGLIGAGADAKAIDKLLEGTTKRVFLLHDVHRSGPCLMHSRWALSYLRGPLTRDEVGRLTKERGGDAPAVAPVRPSAAAGPPMLPAPFKHAYFRKYGAELADPHVLGKYAVRYKGAGETIAVRAWPLSAAAASELLEAEPLEVDEAAVSTEAPDGLRYGELPVWLASAGAKGIEKALRERLPAKLATSQLYDPVTKAASQPGEDRDAFVARLLQTSGAGPRAEKLRDQIEKKKRDLALKEQEMSGRSTEKWAAAASAGISILGALIGGRRGSGFGKALGSVSKAGTVLSKNRMENTAEARVEGLRSEISGLEADLQAIAEIDPARFEEKTVVPAKADVKLLRYDVVWVY
jgi:hypothetical protein